MPQVTDRSGDRRSRHQIKVGGETGGPEIKVDAEGPTIKLQTELRQETLPSNYTGVRTGGPAIKLQTKSETGGPAIILQTVVVETPVCKS